MNHPEKLTFTKFTRIGILVESYDRFEKDVLDQKMFFLPYNMEVIIDHPALIEGRNPLFWHLVGFSEEKRDIYKKQLYPPCTNTEFSEHCSFCSDDNPQIIRLANENKIPCLFRSSYISFILQIIDICNELSDPTKKVGANDSIEKSIKLWDIDNPKNAKELLVFLMYSYGKTNYVILMRTVQNKKFLKIVSSFPVFENDLKKEYKEKYGKAKRDGRKKIGP